MKNKFPLAFIALGWLVLSTGHAQGLVNGGFETGDFTGWAVSGNGSSGVVRYGTTSFITHSGLCSAYFVETPSFLGSHGITPGSSSMLTQTLPTQTGGNVLSFWVYGLSNGDFSVAWNGNTLTNQNVDAGWTHLDFVVTGSGPYSVLQFVFPPQLEKTAETILDDVSVMPLPVGYNQITARQISGREMQLSFVGFPGVNYTLDRTYNLAPPIVWVPQLTLGTDTAGNCVFSALINATTNNFWRVRLTP